MRKLDIIESNIEPDKNNIWLKDDKLLVFLNGEYKDIVKQSFNYNLVYTDTPFTPSQFTEIPITIGSYNIKCKIKNMSFSENTKRLTVNVVKEESE